MPAVPVMEFISTAQVDTAKDTIGTEPASEPQKVFDLPSWEDVLENCSRGIESVPFQTTLLSQVDTVGVIPKQEDILEKFLANSFDKRQGMVGVIPKQEDILEKFLTNSFDRSQDIGSHLLDQEAWQVGVILAVCYKSLQHIFNSDKMLVCECQTLLCESSRMEEWW
jgi:hypothetical protein